jgi:hypothetical protein
MTVLFNHIRQDVRYGARQLARTPMFTAVAAASLGVGIAVTVLVFSIINGLLFKPLPVRDPGSLLNIHVSDIQDRTDYGPASYDDLADFKATHAFSDIVAEFPGWGTRSDANQRPESDIPVDFVSPDYFRVLGVPMIEGRTFSNDDAQQEIIISERYRRRMFKTGDRVIGSTMHVRGVPFTIIGIAPESFK